MTGTVSIMFLGVAAAMAGAGVSARRTPSKGDQNPRLWFAAAGLFLLAAAIGPVSRLSFS